MSSEEHHKVQEMARINSLTRGAARHPVARYAVRGRSASALLKLSTNQVGSLHSNLYLAVTILTSANPPYFPGSARYGQLSFALDPPPASHQFPPIPSTLSLNPADTTDFSLRRSAVLSVLARNR